MHILEAKKNIIELFKKEDYSYSIMTNNFDVTDMSATLRFRLNRKWTSSHENMQAIFESVERELHDEFTVNMQFHLSGANLCTVIIHKKE